MQEVYSGSEEARSDDGESESGEETKESLEDAMLQTIKEFSIYVRAITKDLEDNEKKEIEQAKKKGNSKIKPIWQDSTFKIDFISNLLMTLLSSERIIKYYITYVWPMKKHLKTRNTDFFIKNKRIYPGAPEEDVAFFKALWSVKGAMTEKEKATVWKFWDTLIEITEAWQDIVHWERSEADDLWITNIDYNKAEENLHKDDDEISEDEEELERARQYMQGNFVKLQKEVSSINNNNNVKATVNKEKKANAKSPSKKTNGKKVKESSSEEDSY